MEMFAKPWVYAMTMNSLCLLALAVPAFADDSEHLATPEDAMPHRVSTSTMNYVVPDVQLVRESGKHVSLADEVNDGRAVVLNFIFTTCSSICPLSSQTLAQFQRKLGPDRKYVHLMSISTDPEQDTPARLREYAKKFGAGPGWQHYTGTLDASLAAQRAFDVYRGDKMSHTPVTLIRAAHSTSWRRIDGFVTPEQLMGEYRQLLALK
jgi:protein SCO1/2